jgi:hypothetical protein
MAEDMLVFLENCKQIRAVTISLTTDSRISSRRWIQSLDYDEADW